MKAGDKVILDLESCFEIIECKFPEHAEKQLLGTLTVKSITIVGDAEVVGESGFSCFSKLERLLPYNEFSL
jgi:hypothetical protein